MSDTIESSTAVFDDLGIAGSDIPKTTNWVGPFVIGMAGTILVTGIAGPVVTTLGAAGIVWMVVWTITGYLLCLFLAEMAAMMPNRAGGAPSYAYAAFKERWPRTAVHVNGFCSWAYWHGWFPVAPLNMILASFYIVQLFHLSTAGFVVLGTQIAWWTLGISLVGIALLFIPAYKGMRYSQNFGIVLAALSMIPMTFLADLDHPSIVCPLRRCVGVPLHEWKGLFHERHLRPQLARCRIGMVIPDHLERDRDGSCPLLLSECHDPGRDAKIAMHLEGGYGVFIYTMIPVAFVLVIGLHQLANPALADPKTIFITMVDKVFGTSKASTLLTWLIAWLLILG